MFLAKHLARAVLAGCKLGLPIFLFIYQSPDIAWCPPLRHQVCVVMEHFVFPGNTEECMSCFGLACVASVSVRLRKKRGTRVKDPALVSFLARPKSKIPFLCLSLLRNQTETLATKASFANWSYSISIGLVFQWSEMSYVSTPAPTNG